MTFPILRWRCFKLTDLTDLFVVVNSVTKQVMFLWIDRPIHRTDLVIVNDADLECTKTIILKFHGE